jgi:hypothetical protein
MAKRSKLWFLSALVLWVGLIGIALRRGDEATTGTAQTAKRVEAAGDSRSSAASGQRAMHAAVAQTMKVAADRAQESEPQRKRVREVVGTFTELARAHLYEGESGQKYRQECTALESARCKELFTGAAYEVLAWHVDPAMLAGQLGAGDIAAMDTEIVHGEATELLEHSTDPLERVCMLELLQRSTKLRPVAFPTEVYRDLSAKPVIEASLLLSRSALTGLPDETTTQEVAALASAAKIDPRVQNKALVSLATPSTASLLKDAVRTLTATHDPDWVGWSADVAPALGRCGAACSDVMVEVVAGAADSERLAIYILHRTRSRERGDVLTRLAPALSPATIERLKQSMEI